MKPRVHLPQPHSPPPAAAPPPQHAAVQGVYHDGALAHPGMVAGAGRMVLGFPGDPANANVRLLNTLRDLLTESGLPPWFLAPAPLILSEPRKFARRFFIRVPPPSCKAQRTVNAATHQGGGGGERAIAALCGLRQRAVVLLGCATRHPPVHHTPMGLHHGTGRRGGRCAGGRGRSRR